MEVQCVVRHAQRVSSHITPGFQGRGEPRSYLGTRSLCKRIGLYLNKVESQLTPKCNVRSMFENHSELGVELKEPPASASYVLEIKACATMLV